MDDITHRRGRLGFLESKYHITQRVRDQLENGGASKLLGLTGTAVAITKGIVTAIVATVTIVFMTVFMLLEGPVWVDRFYTLLPESSREHWRGVGHQIYKTVGGYVTGNLLISVIAGISSTIVMVALGVPYAVALGLLVAILDLIPLAGATLAAILVSAVGFIHSIVAGVVLIVFFIVYQQVENHLLQPLVYSQDRSAVSSGDPRFGADRGGTRGRARCTGRDPGRRDDPGAPDRVAPAPAHAAGPGRDDLKSLVRAEARRAGAPIKVV